MCEQRTFGNLDDSERGRGRLIHMTYGTTLCKLLQLTKVSFSFLLFAAAVSALQYRVTHLVGYKLMLTWIWHVTPSCMGRRLLQQRPARPVSCQKCWNYVNRRMQPTRWVTLFNRRVLRVLPYNFHNPSWWKVHWMLRGVCTGVPSSTANTGLWSYARDKWYVLQVSTLLFLGNQATKTSRDLE